MMEKLVKDRREKKKKNKNDVAYHFFIVMLELKKAVSLKQNMCSYCPFEKTKKILKNHLGTINKGNEDNVIIGRLMSCKLIEQVC